MNSIFKIYKSKPILKVFKFIILAILLVAGTQQAWATHIVGGEITYRCLGNNKYEIVLTVYRDCFYGDPNATFDDPAWLAFYKGKDKTPANIGLDGVLYVPYNSNDTLDGQLTSECKVLGQNVCVHRGLYRTIVTLPPIEGGYVITYQRCCRNQTVENIIDPLNTGAIFTVTITEKALRSCNSSPVINDWPPIYICANKPLNYDHSATDVDGDTILYRLCTPYQDGSTVDGRIFPPPPPPYDTVRWKAPFSLQNLLGGSDPLKIDYRTGLITGTPPTVGQFLVGICVDEFRDGVLLSRIRRDFQYNVRECINETIACFNLPDTICNTNEIRFNNCSSGAIEYHWEFPGGTPSSSTEENPLVTYPDFGTYHVRLIARLDSKCVDTLDRDIVLSSATIQSLFAVQVPTCGDLATIKTINNSIGGSNYQWYVNGSNVQLNSSDFAPTFEVPAGTYKITLIAYHMNGCSDTSELTQQVNTLSDVISVKDISTCSDSTFALNPNPNPNYIYTWSPATYLNDPNSPNPIVTNPLTSIDYYVDIFDAISSCTYRDTVSVIVVPIPALAFSWTNDCGVLKVDFQNSSSGSTSYLWKFGDGNTSNDQNPTHTYAQSGTYTVTLENTAGCIRSFSQQVSVDLIDIASVNDSFFLCDESIINLNPNPITDYEYEWSPANLLDDPTSPNPKATVTEYTVFTVKVSHKTFSDCYVIGRVAVDVAQVSADANGGNLICEQDSIPLHLNILNGPVNPTIEWTPDVRILRGQGTPTLVVFATENITYHVKLVFSNGCIIERDVPVNVSDFGGTVYITADRDTIFDVEKIQLNAYPKGLKYKWTPTTGLSDPTIDNPIFTPPPGIAKDYTFSVEVTNADGCILSGSITLTVRETQCNEKHIFLPNAFSPNGKGDPRNEKLRLHNNGVVDKMNKLVIFNRFGQEVFTTTDLNFEWDGTFNGKQLDPDVYGYYLDVLCIGGERFIKKGNVTIIK